MYSAELRRDDPRQFRDAAENPFAGAVTTMWGGGGWGQKNHTNRANQGTIMRYSISRVVHNTSDRLSQHAKYSWTGGGYHGDVRLFAGAGEVSEYSLHKYIHISLFSMTNRINLYIPVFSTVLILYNLLMSWININANLICLPNFSGSSIYRAFTRLFIYTIDFT